ncbi:TadE/TadG family type IV pilus assembly protein [Propionicimonas sp.]|uniref:TadE/TadG family type IV pilus assembly protein n=1 Tax=Propionicimonas sp. TaxID=1955623 RepID=UPI0017DCFB39|nr:TadE family protein [Propionicimonas sp.]MBU3975795.1 pilus assembly protein [Actinomycetota bacterium]MBA3022216.1 pilus assembly protein [Propionicimonas sp.]MBU3987345.1 pilus assembly protein [Actinomycetota bacterium]MBU4006436.1 pilus assembly protein [Actinomycetota bacterium]MBU4065315.1 pilus assembly protein [Actinomycetota bacterium]
MRKLMVRARERGAAAVEFALVLPILVVILLGVIDFGLAMNAQAITANAAREGARTASLGGTAAETKAAAKSATVSLLNTSGSNPTVTVTCREPGGSACPSGYDTDREAGGTVIVTVSYVYTWISPAVLGLPGTTTINKTSEMRIE